MQYLYNFIVGSVFMQLVTLSLYRSKRKLYLCESLNCLLTNGKIFKIYILGNLEWELGQLLGGLVIVT